MNFGGDSPQTNAPPEKNKEPDNFPSLAELMADKPGVINSSTNEPPEGYQQAEEPPKEELEVSAKAASHLTNPESTHRNQENRINQPAYQPDNTIHAHARPSELPTTYTATSEKREVKKGFSSKLSNAKSKGLPSLASLTTSTTSTDSSPATQPTAMSEPSGELLYDDRPATDFNLAELWKAWDEYAAMMKEEDKQSYYSTLTKHKPVMREKFQIDFLVDNHVQKSDIDNDKVRLLEFLREKLNNWKIKLESSIDDTESDDGDSLYDPYKKYEAMIDKNPMLARMKQIFDLDVDYDG